MNLLLPGIFSAIVSYVVWLLVKSAKAQKTISSRILNNGNESAMAPSVSLGEILSGNPTNQEIRIDEIGNDRFLKSLIVAGMGNQKYLRFVSFTVKLAIFIPIAFTVIYILTDTFTTKNLVKSCLFGLGVFSYPHFSVHMAKKKRQKRISKNLPDFLDLLVVCVEAGLGFAAALERMLKEVDPKEPLSKEFSTMLSEFLGGLSLAQACERMSRRCDIPEVSFLLNSIVLSDRTGASLGTTLRVQAEELRDKNKQKAREKAHKIPVKILFPIMPFFFSTLAIAIAPAASHAIKVFTGKDTKQVSQKNVDPEKQKTQPSDRQ